MARLRWLAVAAMMLGCRSASAAGASAPSLPALPDAERAPGAPKPAAERDRELGIAWRFHAGSPIPAAPSVGPRGEVYVASSEGYVHALAADGAFKWSYTITGAALGSVALSAGHLAHVATAAGLVYALRPSGTLAWKFRAPVPPTTGIRVSPRGLLLYGARDGLVYALSHSGRLVWTQALDGGLAVGPVISPSGALIAGSSRGTLLIRESAQRRHTALIDAAWAAEPVASPSGDVHVLTDEGLVTVTAKGSRRWALTGVRAVAASPDGLVVATDVELQWVTTSGSVVRRAPLAEPASAPPCVTHGGHVYVPTATGALLLLSPQGALLRRVDVAARALYAPTCVGRGLIGAIVGAEDGSVAAALGP